MTPTDPAEPMAEHPQVDGGPVEAAPTAEHLQVDGGPVEAAPTAEHPQVDGGQVEPAEAVLSAPAAMPTRNRIVGWATDLGTPTILVLLRHGETSGSVAKLFSGRGGHDHELTPLGHEQARRAAAALSDRGGVTAIVSSPLRRCRETAAAAAQVLGLDVEVDDDLAEAGFGEWDGRTYEQVERRWPDELAAWLGHPGIAPPGGESIDAVEARVRAARDRILVRHPGQVVLVSTHVNPIKSLVRGALDAPPHAVYRMTMAPASLTELDYYPDGTAVLRTFAASAHLIGALSLPGR